MPKTLDDAIGCWTVNPDYNSLPIMGRRVLATANRCRRITLRKASDPTPLMSELLLLQRQIQSMAETTADAVRRLNIIIDTKELEKVEEE